MNQLIIPDVHEEFDRLQRALEHQHKADRVVFLGDFFDSFRGVTEDTHRTAEWLSDAVWEEKYTFLWGNHDAQYASPNPKLRCGGYEKLRATILEFHLHPAHWERFLVGLISFGAGDTPYLISHAGLAHEYWVDMETLIRDIDEAENSLFGAQLHPFFRAGYARGGDAPYGGLTWLDWDREFEPIPGVNQIVGHTSGKTVRKHEGPNSVNYCLDTGLKHVALLDEDGHLEVIEI